MIKAEPRGKHAYRLALFWRMHYEQLSCIFLEQRAEGKDSVMRGSMYCLNRLAKGVVLDMVEPSESFGARDLEMSGEATAQ